MLYDSICIKIFKCPLIGQKAHPCLPWKGAGGTGKGGKEGFERAPGNLGWAVALFVGLILVMVSRVHTCVRSDQIMHLKSRSLLYATYTSIKLFRINWVQQSALKPERANRSRSSSVEKPAGLLLCCTDSARTCSDSLPYRCVLCSICFFQWK